MRKSYEIDMCNCNLLSGILRFAFPLMCSGILQLLFNAADIVVVGQYAGSNAMAAVGSTSALINLLVNFFIGISVGANVLLARSCGENNLEAGQKTVETSLLTGLCGGLFLTVLGILAARPLLVQMGTPPEVLEQAVLYMRLYFLGMPASMIYNFGAALLRAVGDTRRPLYFLLLSGIINVICNLFFVIALHWDVAGVAVATVISQCISAGLILFCLAQTDGVCHVHLRNLHFSRWAFLQMMRIGVPAGLQSMIFNFSNVLIQSSINSFGAIVMAGNTAAANIEGFVYTSMNAFYQTNLSFTSQNLGAKNYARINRILLTCLGLVFVVGLVLGQGAYRFGRSLLRIYSSESAVIDAGMIRLSVVGAFYFPCGMMDVSAGSVRGMGYSVLPMLVSLVGACLLRIVWIYTIFRAFPTLKVLYLSYPVTWVLTLAAHLLCFLIIRHKVFPKAEAAV